MLRSPHPSTSSRDDHLNNLLDQHTPRPDFHGRHPPSQYSDSTSAYNLSLHSQDTVHDSDASAFLRSPLHSAHSTSSPRSYSVHTDDLAMSMLDLGDNSSSSYASSINRDTLADFPDPSFPPRDDGNEDEELNSRMNLGPRMRFHSPAPWEVDEAAQQVDSSKNPQRSPARELTGAARKMFHLRTPSNSSRPSVDSSRSQDTRQSVDTATSSQVSYPRGALYALAQESLSRTSVDSSSSSIRRKFSRPKFPFGPSRPTPTTLAVSPLKTNTEGPHQPHISHCDDDVHPYANPDLVKTYTTTTGKASLVLPIAARTNVIDLDLPQSTSPTSIRPHPGYDNDPPRSPVLDGGLKSNVPSPQRRQISLPLSVQTTSFGYDAASVRGGISNLPGWTEKTGPAPFALISLEEAQAQRSRGALSHIPISSEFSAIPFPKPGEDAPTNHSPSNSVVSDNRARSLSSSSKAKPKNSFQSMVGMSKPERRDSEPATVQAVANTPKSLKHKKSGFMRLFNGTREKEEHPPVPSISDPMLQSVSPKSSAPPSPLIPSPSFYPATPSTIRPPTSPNQAIRKAIPPLSINTLSTSNTLRPASAVGDSQDHQSTLSVPWTRESLLPQSAPANVSEFPALKLRPVSALFSAQLADQMGLESRPSLEADLDTPRSSSPVAVTSPLTPSSSSRFDTDHGIHVRNLEDKLVSARLAWQRQIWELEGQVRDLKAEIEELRKGNEKAGYCDVCRRGNLQHQRDADQYPQFTPNASNSLSRPRARTGTSSRFGNAIS